ncbi:MAG: MOSC domain-containing protein [Rubrobacteraceae bacterium]
MRLSSVNVGNEKPIQNAGKSGKTGTYKRPVGTPVEIISAGLSADTISDTKNHGGLDQAVYVFGVPDYDWWTERLGYELPPGTFGENLTISGLESANMSIGDRLEVGTTVLEVTAPRIPCATLAARMGDPLFVKRFRQAERPGVYCRVVKEGTVRAGDAVKIQDPVGGTIPVIEVFRDYFEPQADEKAILRQLAAPIASRARKMKEKQLGELLVRRGEPLKAAPLSERV